MSDKTTIGISDLLRQFIEALVEEVVLEGKLFDDKKKTYLQRYSQEEGVDYDKLEKNLMDFFEVMEEWDRLKSKSSQFAARVLAKDCYISESETEKLFSTPRQARRPNMLDGHEYVDLGLPSGTLWATCNVGASKPEEYGNYFAWGETSTKSTYNWSNYKYANGNYNELTKYCNKSNYGNNGSTDPLTTLQVGDDPATTNWSSGWCTPSKAQWEELLANTTPKWTTQNGKAGYLFTSKKNGQSVFLPAAGYYRWDGELSYAGNYGHYWSRSLDTGYPNAAWYLYFYSDDCRKNSNYRFNGYSVRPVREK